MVPGTEWVTISINIYYLYISHLSVYLLSTIMYLYVIYHLSIGHLPIDMSSIYLPIIVYIYNKWVFDHREF